MEDNTKNTTKELTATGAATEDSISEDVTTENASTECSIAEDVTTENATIESNIAQDTDTANPSDEAQDKTEAENITEVQGEDNLELRKMKFMDRLKAKQERFRKNTEGMSKKEKIGYFVHYYKWHVIIGIVLLFCAISIPITIYKNSRPVAIAYAVVNCDTPGRINKDSFEDYAEFYNMSEGYQIIDNVAVYLNIDTYEEEIAKNSENSSYTQFPLLCYNNYYDIIITDRTGLTYCTVNSLVQPLEDRLTDDILELFNSEYPELIVMSDNYDYVSTPYAIDISHTEFAKNLNLGYEEVFVCFPGSEERNFMNAKRFLSFVFELDIEI